MNLALALKAQGRFEEAATSLEGAVASNPENADALEGLASYYAFKGDAARAASYETRLRRVRAQGATP